MVTCATCNHPVPAGARFCPSCGTGVTRGDLALEERRVVTVLFADLVGYTSLAEHLDPERVKRLVEACFERLVADIELFGGRVDKLLGDAIVALFGAPVAHEDDAERAVRAALRMQDTLARYAAEIQADELRMRIGINTGEVLVGILAGSDYTAMGDVVNTASRLQALAPPGGVLAGAATIALCPPSIHRERFGITRLPRARAGRAVLADHRRRRGRHPPGALRRPVHRPPSRAHAARRRRAAGPQRPQRGGVDHRRGGSRQVPPRRRDHRRRWRARPSCCARRARPTATATCGRRSSAASPRCSGVDTDASPEEVAATVRARAQELWNLDAADPALRRYLDVVGFLLGHDSPLDRLDAAGARDAVLVTLTEMVRRHAETRMTVLFVDNLQWADPSLRDHLGVIVRSLSDLPFLLVTAQRPDGDLGWPPPVERPLVLQVPLGPLDIEEATALVCGIFENAGAEPTERTVATLVDRGGGNPLFLVELASLSATCGNELPGSLRALIAARIDQLPAAQRAIIDNAAVLGTADSVGALVRFAEAMGQEFRQRDLDELAADGLLDVEGRWWRFRSAVVREVAYQTLTKRVRAQRHAGVAAVLAERGASIDDVAHHAATAAELLAELGTVDGVSPTITEHAIQALLEAATAARRHRPPESAIRAASRALDLHPRDAKVERALLLVRAEAELERRKFAEAAADAEEVLDGALEPPATHRRGRGPPAPRRRRPDAG